MIELKEINSYALGVPKGAKDFEIIARFNIPHLFYHYPKPYYEMLDSGQWELEHPYPVSQYREQDAREIVESAKTFGYRNYGAPNGAYQWYATAKESLSSLLKKYSLTEDIVLLKKK